MPAGSSGEPGASRAWIANLFKLCTQPLRCRWRSGQQGLHPVALANGLDLIVASKRRSRAFFNGLLQQPVNVDGVRRPDSGCKAGVSRSCFWLRRYSTICHVNG